jgi:hypothetical protein
MCLLKIPAHNKIENKIKNNILIPHQLQTPPLLPINASTIHAITV